MADYRRIFLDGCSYYITIVTHARNPILIENIDLLRASFRYSMSTFAYRIDAIVVLPDHIHMIITPQIAREYSDIVASIKRYFTKHCDSKYYDHLDQSASRYHRGFKPVWQKRFYEHTIRDERDMQEKLQYIYHNPVKHGYADTPQAWQHSSMNRKQKYQM